MGATRAVMTKLALQQLVFSPLFLYPSYYTISGIARNMQPEVVWEQVILTVTLTLTLTLRNEGLIPLPWR